MSTDVRDRILIAAERLFAERGVENVSLREVADRAGQRNHSAVQYHFGGRSGLIQALYDLRLVPLNRTRTRMLEEADEASTTDLARIYVTPLSDAVIASGGSWAYARFLDRYLGRGREFEPFDDQHGSGSREVLRRMTERMGALPAGVREERLRMIQVLEIRTLADLEHRLEHGLADRDAAALTVESLVEAVTILVEAPSPPT